MGSSRSSEFHRSAILQVSVLTRYRKQFIGKEDKVHRCSLDIKALGV